MNDILIKYRNWHLGESPKPIKLEIPGWAGLKSRTSAQPWQCQPFIDGNTYGLELLYPFSTECHVKLIDGKITFNGDFTEENKQVGGILPPFLSFAGNHFGMTSCLDIQVPEGYVLRLESHPRFYTDNTNTVPCVVPGHLQTYWWPKIFFVVFKYPILGQTYIFRKGEPYAQILIIPEKNKYEIKEMTEQEKLKRNLFNDKMVKYAKKYVKNSWTSDLGYTFDDKYKILSKIYAKFGIEGLNQFISNVDRSHLKLRLIHENKTI